MVTHFVDYKTVVPDEQQPGRIRAATSQDLANQVKQCKKELLREMKKEAVDIGANAVVGIKTDDTAVTPSSSSSKKLKIEMYGRVLHPIGELSPVSAFSS